ncbi:protein TWIN LOV 1 isoform X5 [Carica papaya]|uniref:protein TWIN LOV 1 isoform X5 n=1 Tax=Carica papaya TaxID=3649 RepID=UPI000B8CA1EB|nr:protein TWIN LOV 1 isoform X5 [Carica papaya]
MEESTSSPTTQLGLIEQSFNCRYSRWVREALDELPESFTITDPSISGHPIVFASRGFLKMTGYSREEVIGKNGRVFQGPRTNRRSVMEIRQAIREERTVEVPIYAKQRRNGARFSDGGSGLPEVVLGSCRREVCSDSLLDFGLVLSLDTNPRESENDEIELSEASDLNKQRALGAINNILSVLTHYSESTGRVVCGKRCCLPGAGFLSSSLNISLGRIKQSFVLTDSQLPDMPIVYASDAFLKLTGYDRHEVLGRNCRFLSGEDTDSLTLYQIKQSIHGERACTVRILNYRKDKSIFWNFLHISPVRNASGKIAYFVGVQIEECCKNQDINGLNPDRRQLSAVGAVKIAVRSSSMGAGSSLS